MRTGVKPRMCRHQGTEEKIGERATETDTEFKLKGYRGETVLDV